MRFSWAIAIFVLAILIASTASLVCEKDVFLAKEKKTSERQRIVHAPIYINGNDDFAMQAQQNGWPGNGTQENPYVIEGYEIDGNGGTYCIWIENTDVYFVIRNCYVHGATNDETAPYGAGIALNIVKNGVIITNNCSVCSHGMYIASSRNINITNNNIIGDINITNHNIYWENWGIFLDCSKTITITSNTMQECGIGIKGDSIEDWNTHNIDATNLVNGRPVYYYKNQSGGTVPTNAGQLILANCSNMTVCGLNISNTSMGIRLGFSFNNTIISNELVGNHYGLYLYNSSNNHILNNNASLNSQSGIFLYFSNNNTITNNNASGNFWFGLLGAHSSNNTITNNNASSNFFGIFLVDLCNYNTITDNNVSGNLDFGICLVSSSNYNTITNNHCDSNGGGIGLGGSSNNTIDNNNINGNSRGVALSESSNNKIINNCVLGNWRGIELSSSDHNTIFANNANSNTWCGIYIGSSNNNFIANNNACNNGGNAPPEGYGIFLKDSNNNTITNNNASGNYGKYGSKGLTGYGYGIYLSSSNNNTISGNKASGNYGSGPLGEGYGYGLYLVISTSNKITYNWLCDNLNYGIVTASDSTENAIHHNILMGNNGASRGVHGSCQAYDDVGGNSWYDNIAKEGNYWSNWDGKDWGTPSAYPIDGGKASDWYPLSAPVSLVEVNLTLEKTEIEGRKDNSVEAKITVKKEGVWAANIPVTLDFDKSGLNATTASTDKSGTAIVRITLTQDFTQNTTITIMPKATVDGIDYTGPSATLTIKGVTYNITLALEASQIDGIKGRLVNATATVLCNTTPVPGINVTLTATPDANITITPTTAITDANGTARFTIMLTADFTNNTTVTIEPVATINGINYTGAAANLTIKAIAIAIYEVSLTLAAEEIEGKKNNTVQATVSVKANGVGVANLTITLAFDKSGLSAATVTTDENGTALLTITITEDFSQDAIVKVTPKVEGKNYPDAAKNLMVKAMGETQPKTPGFEIIAFLAGLTAAFLACKRKKSQKP